MRAFNADVIIIGAGVIGSAVAYYLAKEGVGVTLFERGDVASGSSGACDGLILMQSKKPGVHLQLALESRRQFEHLKTELPVPIEFRASGGLVIIETDAEKEAMARFVAQQRQIGLDVTLLDGDQIRRLEPGLSDHILGATHSAVDGHVNPMALTLGFILGAKKLGARVYTHTRIEGVEISAGRVVAVETSRGRFKADVVVNAAGVRAPDIGKMADLEIPIKPRRGQLVVTQACRPMLSHCVISAKYIAVKFNPDLASENGEGVSMDQTANGNFLLGATREFVGFDNRTTMAGLKQITTHATRMIPDLKQVGILRTFAGLRPFTPDGLPILGPVDGIDGFFMAAGHEGDGIALSPITGRLMAQMITKGRTDIDLGLFRLSRFSKDRLN